MSERIFFSLAVYCTLLFEKKIRETKEFIANWFDEFFFQVRLNVSLFWINLCTVCSQWGNQKFSVIVTFYLDVNCKLISRKNFQLRVKVYQFPHCDMNLMTKTNLIDLINYTKNCSLGGRNATKLKFKPEILLLCPSLFERYSTPWHHYYSVDTAALVHCHRNDSPHNVKWEWLETF